MPCCRSTRCARRSRAPPDEQTRVSGAVRRKREDTDDGHAPGRPRLTCMPPAARMAGPTRAPRHPCPWRGPTLDEPALAWLVRTARRQINSTSRRSRSRWRSATVWSQARRLADGRNLGVRVLHVRHGLPYVCMLFYLPLMAFSATVSLTCGSLCFVGLSS